MTTKAKRKMVDAWVLYDGAGDLCLAEAFVSRSSAESEKRLKDRLLPQFGPWRVVHLTESDAAEVKALRRVARAAKLGHTDDARTCLLCRSLAALKKVRR